MNEELKMKKIIPIIGFKNSGKTEFLNTIFGINIQKKENYIPTEFVNIFRYNPEIKESRFFHLNLKINNKKFFVKDEQKKEIIGNENIKQEIKRLNKDLNGKKFNVKDVFYMTEINDIVFENEENKKYFLNNDLCDIPGLILKEIKNIENEEEDELKYQPKGNKDLSDIFKILKNYIENFIIILDINNYRKETIKEIISHLKNAKINEKISNCLVLLNKIDESKEPEEDNQKCQTFFRECFPKYEAFNLNKNTFLPISISQLILKKDFKQFIRYQFLLYRKLDNNNNSNNDSFINYLKKLLPPKITDKIKKDIKNEKDEEIKIISQELKETDKINLEIDKKLEEKKSLMYDDYLEEKDEKSNSGQDDNNSNIYNESEKEQISNIDILKILKKIYKNENEFKFGFPEETKKLEDYFKIKKNLNNSFIKQEVLTNEEQIIINKLKEILLKFKNIHKLKEKIEGTINHINSDIDFLEDPNNSNIYIPFLGLYNSGKSTIINGIIGKEILPIASNECTKKGIIISYCNKPEIIMRNAKLKTNYKDGKEKNYFEIGDDIIASGFNEVQNELKFQNLFYCRRNYQNYSFYNIRINIQLFDEIGLPDYLKRRIHLIDLPGFGTRYNFQFDKIIKICNYFVITSRNVINQDENREIVDKIKKIKGKLIGGVIKECFFICNIDSKNNPIEEDRKKAEKEITKKICNLENYENKINLCFFNAKLYLDYINKKNYFANIETTIKKEYNRYKPQKFFKNIDYFGTMPDFGDFLIKVLKAKKESFIELNNKSEHNKSDIFEAIYIEKIIKDFSYEKIPEEKVKAIAQLFVDCIKKIKYPEESNFEILKNLFKNYIVIYNNEIIHKKEEKIKQIINCYEKILNQKYLEDINKNSFDKLKKSFNIFKREIKKLILNTKEEIEKNKDVLGTKYLQYLINKKFKIDLKEKNREIIKSEIISESKKILDEVCLTIENYLDKKNEISIVKIQNFVESFKFEEPLNNFLDYFWRNTAKENAKISDEIYYDINKCFEYTKTMIFDKQGVSAYIYSVFKDKDYLINFIDSLAVCYKNKLDEIFNLINRYFESYMDEQLTSINTHIEICSTKFIEFEAEELSKLNDYCKPTIEEIKNDYRKYFN